MKKIVCLPAEELLAGMVVAAEVVDGGGRVLLPVGAELSASSIAGLMRREIEQVSVEVEVEEAAEDLEKYQAELEAQLARLFRRAGNEPETLALYQAILDYRMEHRL